VLADELAHIFVARGDQYSLACCGRALSESADDIIRFDATDA
jgi:hypothetical protein